MIIKCSNKGGCLRGFIKKSMDILNPAVLININNVCVQTALTATGDHSLPAGSEP